MQHDQILRCDCVEGMRGMPDACIPLTVTSPPYDSLRGYEELPLDKFRAVADQLFRVTAHGGVVAWVVKDETKDWDQTGTSHRQSLYFKEVGFKLNTTLILASKGWRTPDRQRYPNPFHYGFILTKGRPRVFNRIRDRPNSTAGQRLRVARRNKDGRVETTFNGVRRLGGVGTRSNIWYYDVGWGKTTKDEDAFEHPALMPERMAQDLILSWSKPGDVIFDPFCGAASTLKMALLHQRRWLGMEISESFAELARRRMKDARLQHRRQLDEFFLKADRTAFK
jgi:DNA modification methylase